MTNPEKELMIVSDGGGWRGGDLFEVSTDFFIRKIGCNACCYPPAFKHRALSNIFIAPF